MALATRCPACSTVFRISTAQAAAKGGMVRCGQCRNVFNSLDALVRVEDLEVIDETSVESTAATGATAGPPAATELADEVRDTTPPTVESAPSMPLDRGVEEAPPSDTAPAAHDAIADSVVDVPWWLPQHEGPDSADSSPAGAPLATSAESSVSVDMPSATTVGGREDAGRLLAGSRGDVSATGPGFGGTHPTFMRPDPATTPAGQAMRRVLAALSAIAAIVLLAQTAFLWRDELAVRWTPARSWLIAACVPLRCTVDYPIHPDSITIESASIQTTGANPDSYLLTALLRNRDTVDVRYPHLELVLTDVQDRPILRRALRPEDYLPAVRDPGRSPTAGFAAESELPIRVMFELSDLRFAGYRLDKFYP